MNRLCPILLAAALATATPLASAQTASFFASRIVEYAPGDGNSLFPDSSLALGGPRGDAGGSLHVVTLGVQGELVLGFELGQAVTDLPGPDFIVSENPNGSPWRFAELIRVGVSTDGLSYAFFPTWCNVPGAVGPYEMIDPSLVSGFAGVELVWANVDTNAIDPFDPAAAGGDGFDLADLAGDPLVVAGAVDLDRIYYVKLRDVLGDGSEYDDDDPANPIYDPTGFMVPPYYNSTSADVDALSVIHGLPKPIDGDANRDGYVDGLDYVCWSSNYGQGGKSWDDGEFTGDGVVDGLDYIVWSSHYHDGTPPGGLVPEPTCAAVLAAGAVAAVGRRRRRAARRAG